MYLQQSFNELLLFHDFNLPDIEWANYYCFSSPQPSSWIQNHFYPSIPFNLLAIISSAKFLSFLSQHTTESTHHHPSKKSSVLD